MFRIKALAQPSSSQQTPGVAMSSALGGGASPPFRPVSLPAVANPPVSAIAGRPPSPVITANVPAPARPVPKVNVVASGPVLPSSSVVHPPVTAVVGRPPAPVIAAKAPVPVPARPVPKGNVAANIPAVSSSSVAHLPVAAVAGRPPGKVAVPNPALATTKTTVQQTTTKTVAKTPVKGTAKKCGADNKFDLNVLLQRTPPAVLALLQLVYVTVFRTFESVYPLQDVFTNCGGKCVAMIITVHAKVLKEADTSLQDETTCLVRNDACLNSVNNKALAAMSIVKPKIVDCFSSVGITFTKDGMDKISASFVEGIKSAIKNDAQLLDEENRQATIAPGTVAPIAKPVQGQGSNVKKPVAIVTTPPRVPAQTQPVRLPAPASTIQISVKPKPATTVPQG